MSTEGDKIWNNVLKTRAIRAARKEAVENKNRRADGNICVYMVKNYPDTYKEAVKTTIRSQNKYLHKKAQFDSASALLALRNYEFRDAMINFEAEDLKAAITRIKAASDIQHTLLVSLLGTEERLRRRQTELERIYKIGATESCTTRALANANADSVYASLAICW
jgi:hypothetical protein